MDFTYTKANSYVTLNTASQQRARTNHIVTPAFICPAPSIALMMDQKLSTVCRIMLSGFGIEDKHT